VRSFDKGCSRNLREFLLTPPEARDRDVEFNESVAVPLLELELQSLLSGGRGKSTVVSVPKEAAGGGSEDATHSS
jgi:hypothetical protein